MLSKNTTLLPLFLLFMGMMSQLGSAQQFVYKPINPAFGGDTFNYQWLIQSAEQQNRFTDPALANSAAQQSELDAFSAGLNRQLLSQLQRALLTLNIDPDTGLQPGTFSFGSLEVEILESLDGLVLNILDTTTGDQTQVIVPRN